MMQFAWPWMGLMLILPLLVWWGVPAVRAERESALQVPDLHGFDGLSAARAQTRPGLRQLGLFLLWSLLVLAAMRPQWVGEPQQTPSSGRDLILGVDISGSMQEEDFRYAGRYVSRLAVVRELARQFIARREGDRIGLILFGEQAYVQTPLTLDRNTVQHFLAEATVGLAGKATAIGDAIGLSIKRLRERPEGARVLILLTDGANTAGNVDPAEAAQLAKRLGIRIYTIGVGSDGRSRSAFGFPFGGRGSDLDEAALIGIAEATGGEYFRARSTEEMEQIYARIDQLEPTESGGEALRPRKEWFHWPLGLALLCGLSWLIVGLSAERRHG
ncbi:VWA domain-containing protein [Granulosicoccaceae sp. 1_MG-2023]|nr:VWA domain-containing protein [Granulosicoccaceae sp. 1_MG-2023]